MPLPNELMLIAAIAVAGGLYLFIRGFRLLARKRLLINTPTSKIRSASLGLVEVSGIASGPHTITAPITGSACYFYRTVAWRRKEEGKAGDWKNVAEETLHIPFFLNDSTGQLLIQPAGAELDIHRDFRQAYDQTWISSMPERAMSFLNRHGIAPGGDHFRIEEWTIQPQSPLFIVGTLAENSGAHSASIAKNGSHSVPLVPPEVVRLSEPVPSANVGEMTQQARIAAALTKAGINSPAAWAAAGVPFKNEAAVPRISQVSVHDISKTARNEENLEFDLAPPVVLKKGDNNPAFVISWRSQQELVSSMAWKSGAMIWLGSGVTLLGIYVLLLQLALL